jgi:hypothetical protein
MWKIRIFNLRNKRKTVVQENLDTREEQSVFTNNTVYGHEQQYN